MYKGKGKAKHTFFTNQTISFVNSIYKCLSNQTMSHYPYCHHPDLSYYLASVLTTPFSISPFIHPLHCYKNDSTKTQIWSFPSPFKITQFPHMINSIKKIIIFVQILHIVLLSPPSRAPFVCFLGVPHTYNTVFYAHLLFFQVPHPLIMGNYLSSFNAFSVTLRRLAQLLAHLPHYRPGSPTSAFTLISDLQKCIYSVYSLSNQSPL